MATLYTHQSNNNRKTYFLMTLFLLIIIGLGYFFSIYFHQPSILYFAVFFSIFMNFFSYYFSDKIVLKMTGAKELNHDENKEIYHLVENLSITAGLPMPKVFIIQDSAPNAFATGRNKKHAVIALTTGLLERLNKNELEGVIAHELSHIGNKDILLSTIIVVLVGFVAILSDILLRSALFNGNRDDQKDGRIGMIMMIAGIVLAVLAPIIAMIIQLAISRKREFLADASGALLTRYPEGLASALEKITKYQGPMKKVSKTTAHLFISSPFGAKKSFGFNKLFMTHPPAEERIKNLREMSF